MDLNRIWEEVVKFLEEKNFLETRGAISKEDFQIFLKEGHKKFPPQTPSPIGKITGVLPGQKILVHSDGASRGNPGPAGMGVVIYDGKGQTLWRGSRFLGKTTNNVAEYKAFLWGVEKALELSPSSVKFCMDSQLIVNQIKGIYRVKHAGLKPLYDEAVKRLDRLAHYSVEHVPREENREADRLANEGIDKEGL